ncbi:MAG: sulfite exporter TauE/SafE family protein [Oscillospiraceae bacterium]|nr:sulfite exporter TauE/SafE family protein [Oscillospiraceae bacterium]
MRDSRFYKKQAAAQDGRQLTFMLLTVSGLLVVLIGLRMWGVPFLRRISPELTRPCRFRGKAFAVGLLTGLMPCSALSSMWIFAASSGSWASGAVSMLAFGAGTCVFMLLFGLLGTFLPKRYNKYLLKGSTILIVAVGLILMTKGIRLLA